MTTFNYNTLKQLKDHLRVTYSLKGALFSDNDVNAKIKKNTDKAKVYTKILYLLPEKQAVNTIIKKHPELMKFEVFKDTLSKINFCLFAGFCKFFCLNGSGNPAYMDCKQQARLNRSKLYIFNSELFMQVLFIESIQHYYKFLAEYKPVGYQCGIRLNGTSDILFERAKFFHCNNTVIVNTSLSRLIYKLTKIKIKVKTYKNIFEAWHENNIDIKSYDYTKFHNRKINKDLYHLTYSYDPLNKKHLNKVNDLNIAVAFSRDTIVKNELPSYHMINNKKLKVIDGDEHDYRPYDDKDYQGIKIIGLKEKRVTDKKQIAKQNKKDKAFFLNANYNL